MPDPATLALDAPPRAAAGWRRFLERAAVAGLLAHALFLPISMAGMQIGLGVAAGALVLLRLAGRRVWARSALDLPCLAVSAAAVVSLAGGALAGSPPVGWHEATLWRSLLAPPVLVSVLELACARPAEEGGRDPRSLAVAALAVWAGASLLASTVAIAQYWTGLDPLHLLGLRQVPIRAPAPFFPGRYAAVGFFRWYQRLAHNLTPPLCVAAAIALYGGVSRVVRRWLGAAALVGMAAVVFTLSRAAIGSLAVALLVLAIATATPRVRRWALPALLIVALAAALHPGVRARFVHQGPGGDNDDRRAIWTVCAEVIRDHPLTGVGWGNFPRRSLPYWDRIVSGNKMRAWCHDSFVTAWAEGGPVLFAALAAYWVLLARAFWRWRRDAGGDALAAAGAAGGLAAVAAMLTNSLAHDILYSSEAMFGLGFALAVGAVLARRNTEAPERSPE